jgi:hypothetical protein
VGDIYYFGTCVSAPTTAIIRRVTAANIEVWSKKYTVTPEYYTFALSSDEQYYFFTKSNTTALNLYKGSATDGTLSNKIVYSTDRPYNVQYTQVKPLNNDLYIGLYRCCQYGVICRWTIDSTSIKCVSFVSNYFVSTLTPVDSSNVFIVIDQSANPRHMKNRMVDI